ncbi:MAG: V-type ATPase subunit [bacterium]
MFTSALRYSYINSKVRALRTTLLSSSQFEVLAKADHYNDFLEKLRLTPYSPYIDNHHSMREHDGSVDCLIPHFYEYLFETYEKVLAALKGAERDLVLSLYSKYELENIKILLHAKHSHTSASLSFPIPRNIHCTLENLIDADNLQEMIDLLRNTPYHRPLDLAFYRFKEEKILFPLERALDIDYYHRVWNKILSLGLHDRGIARTLIGIELDAINLLWIARFRFDFNFLPEQILNYTLMHGYLFELKDRKNMAYCNSFEEMIHAISALPYKTRLMDARNPEQVYARMLQYKKDLGVKYWHSTPFHIGTILYYLFMKEMEVRDLVALAEVKKYRLPMDLYEQYTVHGFERTYLS